MDYISIKTNNINTKSDIYLVGVFTDKKLLHLGKSVSKQNLALAKRCFEKNNFTGEIGDHRTIDDYASGQQILFFGLGDKKKFGPLNLNRSIKNIITKIKKTNVDKISLNMQNLITEKNNITIELLVSYIEDSFYKYIYKKEKNKSKIKQCSLVADTIISNKILSKFVTNGKAIASGIKFAKDLGNTPPNICNPTFLSNEALKLKKINKLLKITVLNEAKMKSMGMGSLLSVSQGSKQPAKLVSIEYMPLKNQDPIVLVGKGITFDTGGISLKPSPNMDEMKYDMSGAVVFWAQ
jgi:leucyl aminopeptidase